MSHYVTNIMIMMITSGLGGVLMITPRAFRRGGGGSAFGVVTRITVKTHESPTLGILESKTSWGTRSLCGPELGERAVSIVLHGPFWLRFPYVTPVLVKKYRGWRRRGRGHRVLDLGCGHGLPGLVALQRGAAVDFLDYNREVWRPLRPSWRPF